MKKQITAILICTLLAFSLPACGGGSSGGTDPSAGKTAADKTDELSGNTESGGDPVSVTAEDNAATAEAAVDFATTGNTGDSMDKASAENSEAPEEEYDGLDPAVKYMEGEETVAETDLYSVTVTGYEPDYHYEKVDSEKGIDFAYDCFAANIRFENKSNYLFRFSGMGLSEAAVNRAGVSGEIIPESETDQGGSNPFFTSFDVKPGETIDARIQISLDSLEEAAISSVDEILFQFSGDMQDSNYIFSGSVNPYIALYPTGKDPDDIIPEGIIAKENMTILAENDDFIVGVLPRDTEEPKGVGSSVRFYLQNLSDRTISLKIKDVQVNGLEYLREDSKVKPAVSSSYVIGTILPGCHTTGQFRDPGNLFLKENGFDEINELSGILAASEYREDGSKNANDSFDDSVEFFSDEFSWKAEE